MISQEGILLKEGKDKESPEKPQAEKKTQNQEMMKGNMDKDYKFDENEKDYVHFYIEDFAAPRPRNQNEQFKPPRRLIKSSPHMFVQQFAENYSANGAFVNVTTPEKIMAICKNLTKEVIEEAYGSDILSATQNDPKLKRRYVVDLLANKKKMRLGGGNQFVNFKDVKHIPEGYTGFPFDKKNLDKIPEDCIIPEEDY